jgi:hypothetical protein
MESDFFQDKDKNHCIAFVTQLFFDAVLSKKNQYIKLIYMYNWYITNHFVLFRRKSATLIFRLHFFIGLKKSLKLCTLSASHFQGLKN